MIKKLFTGIFVLIAVFGLLVKLGVIKFDPEIREAQMASSVNDSTKAPANQATTFGEKDTVYCCVKVANMQKGKNTVTVRWYDKKGEKIDESKWEADSDGSGWLAFNFPAKLLSPGDYKGEVCLDGQVKQTVSFTIKG